MLVFTVCTGIALLAASCSDNAAKTVVIDQNGNVVDTKTTPEGLYRTGTKYIEGWGDMQVYTDSHTGCQYFQANALTPLFDEYGRVAGCKKEQEMVK